MLANLKTVTQRNLYLIAEGILVPPADDDELARRERRWKEYCPARFQKLTVALLPCSTKVISQVLSFPIETEGLRIVGPTGTGKTRMAWEALRVSYLSGVSILALDGMDFGSRASAAYRDGTERDFFWRMIERQILFIDDLGKGKMTARVLEALFTVVDRRGNENKPILTTMNYTAESFEAKLLREEADPETVAALLRRMNENMTTIAVKKL